MAGGPGVDAMARRRREPLLPNLKPKPSPGGAERLPSGGSCLCAGRPPRRPALRRFPASRRRVIISSSAWKAGPRRRVCSWQPGARGPAATSSRGGEVCAPGARAATEPRRCRRRARSGGGRAAALGGTPAGGGPARALGPAGRRRRAGCGGADNLFRGNENWDCWPWVHFTGRPPLPGRLPGPRANSDSWLICCNGQGRLVPARARAHAHTHTHTRGKLVRKWTARPAAPRRGRCARAPRRLVAAPGSWVRRPAAALRPRGMVPRSPAGPQLLHPRPATMATRPPPAPPARACLLVLLAGALLAPRAARGKSTSPGGSPCAAPGLPRETGSRGSCAQWAALLGPLLGAIPGGKGTRGAGS